MARPSRISVVPKPVCHVRNRPDLRDGVPPAFVATLIPSTDSTQRVSYEPRARARRGRAVLVDRLARLLVRGIAARGPRRRDGDLALLRAAQFREHSLAALAGMELPRRGSARELLPAAAQGPAVLHRQHRPTPRAPPQPEDPELQPPARAQREPDLPLCAEGLADRWSAGGALQALGRADGTPRDVGGVSVCTVRARSVLATWVDRSVSRLLVRRAGESFESLSRSSP